MQRVEQERPQYYGRAAGPACAQGFAQDCDQDCGPQAATAHDRDCAQDCVLHANVAEDLTSPIDQDRGLVER